MHPNPAFRWTDEPAMRAFVATRGFAHICVAAAGGPIVAHAPLVIGRDGEPRFHLARANRIFAHLEGARMVASVTAHDFYVSPDWYASADQVPTWNYVAVEIEGIARALDDAGLIAQMDALSGAFEAALAPKPVWTRAGMTPGRFEAMLPAITGFALTGATWRGTRKLGQNRSPADRATLAEALAAAGQPDEAAMVLHP